MIFLNQGQSVNAGGVFQDTSVYVNSLYSLCIELQEFVQIIDIVTRL